jgi:hypothetical protein
VPAHGHNAKFAGDPIIDRLILSEPEAMSIAALQTMSSTDRHVVVSYGN